MDTGDQTGGMDESITDSLEIPRDRLIDIVGLDVRLTLDNANVAAQTLTKRQLCSIFASLSININGGTGSYSGIDGGVYYDFLKHLLGHDPIVFDVNAPVDRDGTVSIAGSSTETVRFVLPFYFRDNLENENDVSSLLDSRALSALDLSYTTGAGWSPANTDVTIDGDNSTCNLYLKEVVGTQSELSAVNSLNGYPGFFNVFYRMQRDQALVTSAGLAQNIDMLTGFIHRQVGLATYDATACDWVNDIIDTISLKEIATGGANDIDHIVALDFEASQSEDAWDQGSSVDAGFTVFNAASKVLEGNQPIGGLDMRGKKNGDLKLYYDTGATFAAGDLADLIYKSLLPA